MFWRSTFLVGFFLFSTTGIFAVYLVWHEVRQMDQLLTNRVVVTTQSMAANARMWLLSRDIEGMDEQVHSFDSYPGLEMAMLLDTQGRILAHTQIKQIGQRLPEDIMRKLAREGISRHVILEADTQYIDVVMPVLESGVLLGWARLRLRQLEFNAVLDELNKHLSWFLLVVLFLAAVMSWRTVKGVTEDILQLTQLSQEVKEGNHKRRLLLNRKDELGQLVENFNQMLDTLETKEQELKLRSEALQRSNSELEQFAYVASHDLQEPLRMISSYVQLLQRRYKDKLDDDANEFIGFAVDGASRMQMLIQDLLMYSRVDRRSDDIRPIKLEESLEMALFSLRMSITEKNARIERVPLPVLPADMGQMAQLWQNLIGNALKFHAEIMPVISIEAQEHEKFWRFAVSDNGIGIEPGQEKRIFQIFQRLHTREAYVGTGIGLAICKRIVERHGGTIGVISRYGEGSEFWFTLPKVRQQREKINDTQS